MIDMEKIVAMKFAQKIFQRTSQSQSGQVLFLGLIFILMFSFFSLYCFYFMESKNFHFLHGEEMHASAIYRGEEFANIINNIAVNNRLILSRMGDAMSLYEESLERGMLLGFSQSYWKTMKIGSQDVLGADLKKIFTVGAKKDEFEFTKDLLEALKYSAQNSELVAKLPQKIGQYFHPVRAETSFCAGLTLSKKYFRNGSFFQSKVFSFSEVLHPTKKDCEVFSPSSLFRVEKTILSFKKGDFKGDGISLGPWIVSSKNAKDFLRSLKIQVSSPVTEVKMEQASPFLVIFHYLQKLGILSQETFQFHDVTQAQLTNLKLQCDNHHNSFGDFTSTENFNDLSQCALNRTQFLQSFFSTGWIAFVSDSFVSGENNEVFF